MATLVLVGLDRIAYPAYRLTATGNVFADRASLDAYEAALRREADVVTLLESIGGSRLDSQWLKQSGASGTLDAQELAQAWLPATPGSAAGRSVRYGGALATPAAREAAGTLCRTIVGQWRAVAQGAWARTPPAPPTEPSYFLRRYSAAWVLTRAAGGAAEILERLHLYAEAVQLYRELLGQDRWLLGTRCGHVAERGRQGRAGGPSRSRPTN